MSENLYKKAPTWLYNLDGESRFCKTQEEVNQAWQEGWFGPPFARIPLISQRKWETKSEIARAINNDPRYEGLSINVKKSHDEIMQRIMEFEEEHELVDVIIED